MGELSTGIKIEAEHGATLKFIKRYYKSHKKFPSPKRIYKSIAMDHLKEDPRYYRKLKRARL